MRALVTSDEMKRIEQAVIQEAKIPSLVLMERAAYACLEEIIPIKPHKVLIAAGYGNNGADGLALARMLTEEGILTEVYCVGNSAHATEEWQKQKEILASYPVTFINKLSCNDYAIIVDALFGIGLNRTLSEDYINLIDQLNHMQGYKLAIDVPSGLNATDGSVWGTSFHADETVTFAFGKIGLYLYPGALYAGRVVVKQIGITFRCNKAASILNSAFTYEESIKDLLPVRPAWGHKGTFGKLLIIGGFEKMPGAAIFSARSAYNTGCGMVKVISDAENREIIQKNIPEVLYGTLDDLPDSISWADGIVIGPGLGKSRESLAAFQAVIDRTDLPLLLDADALNLLSEHRELMEQLGSQAESGRSILLTPHVGELKRLCFGSQIPYESIQQAGKTLSDRYHFIMICKDARTVVFSEKYPMYINRSGCEAMATAGSGDVLSGIIGALMLTTDSAFNAACLGTYLHGLAGMEASDEMGSHGVTAGIIADHISLCIRNNRSL